MIDFKGSLPDVLVGTQKYELTFDELNPTQVSLKVFVHPYDLNFGMSFDLDEWKKFVNLVNRFDNKLAAQQECANE